MANTCWNSVSITCPTQKRAEKIARLLRFLTTPRTKEEQKWYTSAIAMKRAFGLENPHEVLSIRGNICPDDMEVTDGTISFSTDSAWSPEGCMTPLMLLKKAYFDDCEICFSSEEPGCDIYVTNDPDLANKYSIDQWEEIEGVGWLDTTYELTEKDVCDLLKIKNISEAEDSESYSVHKWDYEEPEAYIEGYEYLLKSARNVKVA